jgi:hypothetical protein
MIKGMGLYDRDYMRVDRRQLKPEAKGISLYSRTKFLFWRILRFFHLTGGS